MTKVIDLTARKFGHLTVIKRHPVNTKAGKARWIVRCDCDKYKVVVGGSLLFGLTVSCGGGNHVSDRQFNDLTGRRFGNLTVIGLEKRKGGTQRSIWKVRCSCGREETFQGKTLTFRNRSSCSLCSASPKLLDETGKKYGRWSVIECAGRTEKGQALWSCRCECGNESVVWGANLRNGASSQCRVCGDNTGKTKTHGMSRTPEYASWLVRRRTEQKKIFDSSWTLEMDVFLRELFGSCILCGKEGPLDVDHLLPLSLGYGLFTDNATLLCDSCNSKKSSKYISDLPPEVRRKLIDASCEFQDYFDQTLFGET